MPRFATPTPEQVRAILRESHALWGAGLSIADYVAMWEELAESAWGRNGFSWRALIDEDGSVLSSLKLYHPRIRLAGTTGRVAAIGAVFTSRRLRRTGLAAALIRACLEEAEREGDLAALLFTDIGTEYYRALGFTPLPCEDVVGSLPASPSLPDGVTLRPMTLRDLDRVRACHAAAAASRAIAIVRDLPHWEFLMLRAASFFRRLDHTGLERRFVIAMDASGPIGYLVGVVGAGEWNLREAEAFDGQGATLAKVLAAGAADARAASATTVWGWLPRSLSALAPSWRARPQPRTRAIPMIRPLGGRELPVELGTVEAAFIPYLDQF